VTGRAIIARGAPVTAPGPLAILPAAPVLRALRDAEDRTTREQPTIHAIITRYLGWKTSTAAPHTLRTYRDALRHFGEFLAMCGINTFEDDADVLPITILERWIVWLGSRPHGRTGAPLKPATVATYLYAVSDVFKFAVRRKLVPERFRWAEMAANAADALGKVPKRSARHDRRLPLLVAFLDGLPMPAADARDGLSGVELRRNRALPHLLLSSGMRREEVTTLNRTDVEDGWATSAVIIGKGSRERTVFWDADTQQAIRAYMAARTDAYLPLFLRFDNHRGQSGPNGEHWRLSPQSVWLFINKLSKLTGIPATPHSSRHAMASAMLNNDAPITLIQDLLGHSSPTVTRQVYAQYKQRTLRRGFDQYNPTAREQVAELEAEQEQRRGHTP
jgi:site-specific recombinase XerD